MCLLTAVPTWHCLTLVPAVMLEIVQHASFLMLFLWLVMSKLYRHVKAPQAMMTWCKVQDKPRFA